MGYIEKTAYYRRALDECVARGDRENAKLNAIMYMRVLREMAELTDGYGAKAYLQNEADWYESVAVLIALEGVSDRVKIALRDGIGKNVRPIEASSACSPAPIVSVVLPQPEEAKGKDKNPKLLSSDKDARVKAMAEEKIPKDDCLPTAQSSEWIADVFEKRLPATMVVSTESGCGTGFFVSSNGLFLTNHHVVHEGSKRCARINICTGDEKFRCGAKLVATDQKRDLALLQAETGGKRTPFIPLIKDYSKLRPGMDVMVIGNALSFGLAPIAGTVKFTHSKGDNDLIFTAPSNHGDSGGPVLNRQGECVGINKSVTVSVTRGGVKVNTRGLTNATPADEIAELLTNWKK